ncbi:MAG TPA: ELWxxDGT repeat protein [Thermoanaerobaculia bacterium]|nr:ELWxxDGT repeat protein [Thermoanaerobaculia bacterium]
MNPSAPATLGEIRQLTPVAAGLIFVAQRDPIHSDVLCLEAGATQPRLLTEHGPSSYPTPGSAAVIQHGGLAFWQPGSALGGRGLLWRSDGTDSGTFLLRFPGEGSLIVGPSVKGGLLVAAGSGQALGLYRTDGTPEGTRLLRRFPPTRHPPHLQDPSSVHFFGSGHRSYVTVRDRGGRYALMLSDGTPAGTGVLMEFGELPLPTSVAVGPRGFVLAVDRGSEIELWSTGPGHVAPRPITTIPGRWNLGGLVQGESKTCWRMSAPRGRLEVWCSDGSKQGTTRIAALQDSDPGILLPLGDRWFFSASSPEFGSELWTASSDPMRPVRLTDLCPGPCDGLDSRSQAFVLGRQVLVHGGAAETRHRWWQTDGSQAGPRRLLGGDLDGLEGIAVARSVGDGLAFVAEDEEHRSQLWWTNGTSEGTRPLTRFAHHGALRTDRELELLVAGGGWFFVAGHPNGGGHLWSARPPDPAMRCLTCGAASAPGLRVASFPGREDSPLIAFRGGVLFSESQPAGSDRTWFVSSSGSVRAAEVPPFGLASFAHVEAAWPGLLFFMTPGSTGQSVLWQTDGTKAGTRRRAELPLPSGQLKPPLLVRDDRIAGIGRAGGEATIWSTGPSGGSASEAAPSVRLGLALTSAETVIGELLFFSRLGPPTGGELAYSVVRTDGTLPGTLILVDGSLQPEQIVSWQGRAVFATTLKGGPVQLWSSDGTAAGTRALGPPGLGPEVGWPVQLAAAGDSLFLFATTRDGLGPGRVSLFRFEPGGAAQRVADRRFWLAQMTMQAAPKTAALDSQLFFSAQGGTEGLEPWVSDGTPEGTRLLADVAPGPTSSAPLEMVPVGGRVFFSADDGTHGAELWVTDGTPGGTRRVTDIAPGVRSSRPRYLTASGDTLFFLADDGRHGLQLYRLRP